MSAVKYVLRRLLEQVGFVQLCAACSGSYSASLVEVAHEVLSAFESKLFRGASQAPLTGINYLCKFITYLRVCAFSVVDARRFMLAGKWQYA